MDGFAASNEVFSKSVEDFGISKRRTVISSPNLVCSLAGDWSYAESDRLVLAVQPIDLPSATEGELLDECCRWRRIGTTILAATASTSTEAATASSQRLLGAAGSLRGLYCVGSIFYVVA